MTPARVAVQVGAAAVRVAGAGRGGPPRLLAERPAAGPDRLRELLAELLAERPDELLVVGAEAGPFAGLAAAVRVVPAALAVAGPGRRVVVVDVGHGGAEVTLVGARGEVLGARRVPGGARLDSAVAALAGVPPPVARELREAVSLLPHAVARQGDRDVVVGADQVRDAIARPLEEVVAAARTLAAQARRAGPTGAAVGGSPGATLPVLIVGGVARTPLLAEMLDAAGIGPVTVAERPEAAAVLGALRLPPGALPPPLPGGPRPAVEQPLLPPPPRRSRSARAAPVLLAAAAVAIVAAAWPSPASVSGTHGGIVAQYGYVMRLPDGWTHSGGLPERRRTLLTPAGAPDGTDLVAVERTELGYDALAEPERAAADLRAVFDAAVAAGEPLSDFVASGRHAGRPVATYRERAAGGMIDWYVLLDVGDQISVGCQHTPTGAAEVERACDVVVASVRQQ